MNKGDKMETQIKFIEDEAAVFMLVVFPITWMLMAFLARFGEAGGGLAVLIGMVHWVVIPLWSFQYGEKRYKAQQERLEEIIKLKMK